MTREALTQRGEAPGVRREARVALALLLLATLATSFVGRDLWSPDEQRYGQVAREMQLRGDGLVPHLNGQPYAEKPPVFFWAEVLVSSVTGGRLTSAAARGTGCLFAAGAFLLCFVLGRRWFGTERAGTIAALAFGTNLLLLHNATRATMDLTLVFFVLLAVERGSAWLRRGGTWRAALAGLAWAAGALAKGPFGLLLPPLALFGEAAASIRRPPLRAPGWWVAPVAAAAAGMAWLLPALEAGGADYRGRLLGQLLSRATGTESHHVHGPLFYVGILLATGLPWTVHALAGAYQAVHLGRATPAHKPGLLATTCAGGVGLLLLFLMATKREVYLIPVLPFFALQVAALLEAVRAHRLVAVGTGLLVAAPLVGGLASLALPFTGLRFLVARQPWPEQVFDVSRALTLLPALAVFLGGFVLVWRVRADARRVALRAGATLAVGAFLLKAGLFPSLDERKSFGTVARQANAAAGNGEVVSTGPIHEDWLWNLDRTRILRADSAEELLARLAPAGPATAAIVEARWWERQLSGPPGMAPTTRELLGRLREVGRAPAEHRTYVVLVPGRPDREPGPGEGGAR